MLNGKQKRYLRSLAVKLKPVSQIGKDGLSDNLYKSVLDAFNTRELVKLNVLKTCQVELKEIGASIENNCDCELVQIIGKTLVFYKKADEPKIMLP